MNFKGIMMSETSQSQKVSYFTIQSTWQSWKDKSYSDREQISATQGLGIGGGCGCKGKFLRDPLGIILNLDFNGGYMNPWHVLKFTELQLIKIVNKNFNI